MYCSTCGQPIDGHLNYCKSCGARVEKQPVVVNAANPQLGKALAVTVMIGFSAFVAVLKIVLDNGRLDMPATVMILIAYLTALTLIAGMMVGYMWKTAGDTHARMKPREPISGYAPPRSFRGSNTNQLGGPVAAPMGSVTDSTTRTLDEVYVDR
jgi:hypothetical protein